MAKVRKVLMLVENVPVPRDRRVWPEALLLRDSGYEVSVISPKGTTDQRESYTCIDSIHIYRYHLPVVEKKYIGHVVEYSVALLMTSLLSLKVLFRRGFDVVHVANPPDIFFILGLFYRLLGKKFVFDQHDLTPELLQVIFRKRARLLYRALRFFEKCSYRAANLVVVTNESQKALAIERGPCPAHKVFVVRNGPDMRQWRSTPADLQLKAGRPYLLGYVGFIGVQDGVENVLYALYELVHKCARQDISLVVLGDGANLPSLRCLVRELRVEEYINFTGWVSHEEVVRHLSAIDVGLVPDPQNGLNEFSTMLKTMEYMVLGKPVVAFDLKETRYSAQDAALYAVPNLANDFANKIEVLLANEELRLRMGAIGRRRVEEILNWDQTKGNLLLAYKALFAEGG